MRGLLTIGVLVVASSCGPSLRLRHESTVYFERCHAAELDDALPLEVKMECWDRWLRWYSEYQSQTRVIHARERLVYLAQGDLVDPLPTGRNAIAETTEEPAATDATQATEPASRTEEVRPLEPRSTGHSVCAPVCRPSWDSCVIRCDPAERACVSACQNQYAACMAGCVG